MVTQHVYSCNACTACGGKSLQVALPKRASALAMWHADPLWGDLGDLQHFAQRPAEHLVRYLDEMLQSRPAELRKLLMERLSPAFAELLTSKLEEHAEAPGGESKSSCVSRSMSEISGKPLRTCNPRWCATVGSSLKN